MVTRRVLHLRRNHPNPTPPTLSHNKLDKLLYILVFGYSLEETVYIKARPKEGEFRRAADKPRSPHTGEEDSSIE